MNKEMYIEMLEDKVSELKEVKSDNEFLLEQLEQRDNISEKYFSLIYHLRNQEKKYWALLEAEERENEERTDSFYLYRTIWDSYYRILRDFDLLEES